MVSKANHFFLAFMSNLWSSLQRFRRRLYRYQLVSQTHFSLPVISVGNLSFGGTSKTPTVLWLAHFFEKQGKTPLIVTRGYKSKKESKMTLLSAGKQYDPKEIGDEPAMMVQDLKKGWVLVGKKRVKNLKKTLPLIKPDVVIVDDGFQHLSLARNIDIVLIDSTATKKSAQVFPQGLLREPWDALEDADIVVLSRFDQAVDGNIDFFKKKITEHTRPNTLLITTKLEFQGIYSAEGLLQGAWQWAFQKKWVVMAGLGNPQSFFTSIPQTLRVDRWITQADHHKYSVREMEKLIEELVADDHYLMTTEKDMVKLGAMTCVQDSKRVFWVKVNMVVISGAELFCHHLQKAIS